MPATSIATAPSLLPSGSTRVEALEHVARTILQKMDAGPAQTGYELALDKARRWVICGAVRITYVRLVHQWPEDAIRDSNQGSRSQ